MVQILASNLDHAIKVYVDLKGHLATIEKECHNVIEAWEATKLTCDEVEWELEKVQEACCIS